MRLPKYPQAQTSQLPLDAVSLANCCDFDAAAGAIGHDRVIPAAPRTQLLEFNVTAETVPAGASQV